ncbi:stage II sporulation protein M [Clostridium sp. DSM 8431]|uniref:stage II sporulation protein M n=1 Tax=Clostridium sp. DSM 8431 TaxID=1761781 RepID=UPI0008F3D50A|nr:stage II sporulation protein M [Clostridium sp. DSM 8431]SFU45336.1 stage II sporulation protein M [Clostridium sp. DSM 8431]
MKRLIEKINETFKENRGYYVFVLVLFCIGIVIGTYTVKYMSASDKEDLTSYFTTFTNNICNNDINYKGLLLNVVKKNLYLIIPIIICAFTFIGIPVILIVDFIKGFTLGYTFTFLLTTFEGKGFLLALSSSIIQNLIYIPCIMVLSVIALQLSVEKFKKRFFKGHINRNLDPKPLVNIMILIAVFFVAAIIIETYISPSIIKFVVCKLYS